MSDVARVKVTVLDRGPRGPQGPATIEVGTVTVLNPDESPTLVNVGTFEDLVLDVGLPRAAQVDLGTVTAVNPDQPPAVVDSGSDGDMVLDIDLPRAPAVTIGTVTTADPGDPVTVTDVGTDGDVVLDFDIPAGETGITWRGGWDAGTTYAEREAVRHRRSGEDRASAYIALTGSTGVEPPAPGDAPTAEWDVLAAGGVDGGGAETLTELSDVDTTGSAGGDALVFDDVAGLWKPGSAASSLDDLDDVDADDPDAGDVLAYDGDDWVASGAYAPQTEPLLLTRDDKDGDGLFETVEWSRLDGTLAIRSTLAGGTPPEYATRTVVEYEADGTTVARTTVLDLTYDADGDLITEEVQP